MTTIAQILPQIYPIAENYHVIVADGEFPQDAYLRQLIQQATILVACDGAANTLLKYNYTPNYIIGDCDSLSPTLMTACADRIIINPDQNTNDLTKAINFVSNKYMAQQIIILGASGLREDHTIANIALLAKHSADVQDIAIISDYGIFTVHNGHSTIKTLPQQQVSIFSLDITTEISCSELKWPLAKHRFNAWYSGTLNEATGNTLHLYTTASVIVYRLFP